MTNQQTGARGLRMRDIRFRAWDKIENKMMYFELIDYMAIQSLIAYTGNIYSKIEIMQYTGLKDKNGVEIYEKDKLLWHNQSDEPDYDVPYVEFIDGSFKCGSDLLSELDLDTMEVIGNIYESPELLKQRESGE